MGPASLREPGPLPVIGRATIAELVIRVDGHVPRVSPLGFFDGDVVVQQAQPARPGRLVARKEPIVIGNSTATALPGPGPRLQLGDALLVDGRVAEEGEMLAEAEIPVTHALAKLGDAILAAGDREAVGAVQEELVCDNCRRRRAVDLDAAAARLVANADALEGDAVFTAVVVAVHDETRMVVAESKRVAGRCEDVPQPAPGACAGGVVFRPRPACRPAIRLEVVQLVASVAVEVALGDLVPFEQGQQRPLVPGLELLLRLGEADAIEAAR